MLLLLIWSLSVLTRPALAAEESKSTQTCETQLVSKTEQIQRLRFELQKKLGTFIDPFLFSGSLAAKVKTWKKLETAFPTLVKIRAETEHSLRHGTSFNRELLQSTLEIATRIAAQDIANKDLVAALDQSLLKIQMALDREKQEQRSQKEPEPQPLEQKHSQEKNGEEKKGTESPPPPPKNQKEYQVHNKDTDFSDGAAQKEYSIARVDQLGVEYFKKSVFQALAARTNTWSTLDLPFTPPSDNARSTMTLWIKPLSEKGVEPKPGEELAVVTPDGFIPRVFKSSDTEVWRDHSGNFFYKTSLDEAEIPLVPANTKAKILSTPEIDIYTAHTGTKVHLWSQSLREKIEQIKLEKQRGSFSGNDENLTIAKLLTQYISSQYLYRVDKDESADKKTPVQELEQKGLFQCDGAASILVSVLRDEFQIPCQLVAGFVGQRKPGDSQHSHVVLPGLGHAWVEVASQLGRWEMFDPTPRNKDRKQDESKNKSEYKRFSEEKNKEENEEIEKEKEKTRQKPASDTNKGEEVEQEKFTQKDADAQKAAQDLLDRIDKNIKKLTLNNPLLDLFYKKTLLWAIDPSLGSSKKLERLGKLKFGYGQENIQLTQLGSINNLISEAITIFEGNHPPFDLWIAKAIRDAQTSTNNSAVNTLASELSKIQQQIQFTVLFLDLKEDQTTKETLNSLLRSVQKVLLSLNSIRHKDATLIRTAEDLYSNLPGNISRKVLQDKYSLTSGITDDLGTIKLAQDIVAGKLNNYRLMSMLGPHTEFVTDPIVSLSKGIRKTWLPALRRQKGRMELMLVNDPRQKKGAFNLAEPYLTSDEAYIQGQLVYLGQRKNIEVDHGVEDIDPEKATVILVDTSGSMSGIKEAFQTAYVGTVVDRALSDINASTGIARHKVYIIPFDDFPQNAVLVESREAAISLIKNLKRTTQSTNKGTEIEKAILAGAEVFKLAARQGKQALSRGTLILCSDGGGKVNKTAIAEAFDEVKNLRTGKKTDVLMAFVAIGGENATLFDLATSSESLGSPKKMYLSWTQEQITDVIEGSRKNQAPINDFWTNLQFNQMPQSIFSALTRLKEQSLQFQIDLSKKSKTSQIKIEQKIEELRSAANTQVLVEMPRDPARQNEFLKRSSENKVNVGNMILGLRKILAHVDPAFEKTEDRRQILGEIILHFEETIGFDLKALNQESKASLLSLVPWINHESIAEYTNKRSEE